MTYKNMNSEDAVKAWDTGEIVCSGEMGGMGPGYEQSIQICIFECLRWLVENEPDTEGWDTGDGNWPDTRDALYKLTGEVGTEKNLGLSGAQGGSVVSAATMFYQHGYAEALDKADRDRRIQVNNGWVRAA